MDFNTDSIDNPALAHLYSAEAKALVAHLYSAEANITTVAELLALGFVDGNNPFAFDNEIDLDWGPELGRESGRPLQLVVDTDTNTVTVR